MKLLQAVEAKFEGVWDRIRRLNSTERKEAEESLEKAVSPSEVIALVHFVAETGLDPDAKLTAPALQAVNKFRAEKNEDARRDLWPEVLRTYSQLTAVTYPKLKVNGRTIRSTARVTGSLFGVIVWLFIFFILAAVTNILSTYYFLEEPPIQGNGLDFKYWLYQVHHLGLVYLYPAFWGGLGSCIYLTQTIASLAQNNQFDSRRLRGQHSRILLGAIFGAVVVHLFYDQVSDLSIGMKSIGPAGVAFLTGLSVKVVYGALREAIRGVDDAIQNLGKSKEEKTK